VVDSRDNLQQNITKVPTSLKTCRYTTLQNTNIQKLHQPKHSNSKLSVHKLRTMVDV